MIHGIPISNVAPRGASAFDSDVGAVIVSDELLRFKEPLTVDALATLSCFSCDTSAMALLLPLIVPSPVSEVGGRERPLVTEVDEVIDGAPDGRFETIGRLVTGDESELVERTDCADAVLFAIGLDLLGSTGDEGGRFALTDGVTDFAALEGGRLRGILEADVPVVLTLRVDSDEAVDPRRLRAPVLGDISVFAVSNAVDPSLLFDSVEEGRDSAEGGRSNGDVELVFRTVDAWDLTDATEERTREVRSFGDRLLDTLRRPGTVVTLAFGVKDGVDTLSAPVDRIDEALVICPGVSFESGRWPDASRRVVVVAVLVLDTVECVLRATERIDTPDPFTVSPPAFVVWRLRTLARRECMLTFSSSSLGARDPRAAPLRGVPACETGLRRSSTETSISPLISLTAQPSKLSNPPSCFTFIHLLRSQRRTSIRVCSTSTRTCDVDESIASSGLVA